MSLRNCFGHRVQVWVWEDGDIPAGLRALADKMELQEGFIDGFISLHTVFNYDARRLELVAHID